MNTRPSKSMQPPTASYKCAMCREPEYRAHDLFWVQPDGWTQPDWICEYHARPFKRGICLADWLPYTQIDTRLEDIAQLCRKYNLPGLNVGAKNLAGRVLAIVEEGKHG